MSKAEVSGRDINPLHLQEWYHSVTDCRSKIAYAACKARNSRIKDIIDDPELGENAFVCCRTLIVSKGCPTSTPQMPDKLPASASTTALRKFNYCDGSRSTEQRLRSSYLPLGLTPIQHGDLTFTQKWRK